MLERVVVHLREDISAITDKQPGKVSRLQLVMRNMSAMRGTANQKTDVTMKQMKTSYLVGTVVKVTIYLKIVVTGNTCSVRDVTSMATS